MNQELKQDVYNLLIEHPAWTDKQIADHVGISRGYVWKIRNKFVGALDYALAQKVAGKFLADFQKASDYFIKQIDRLEDLKKKKKHITKNNNSTGEIEIIEIPLDPLDILAIEKQQAELWKHIIFLARQGEAVEIMRLIQNGRIPTLNTSSTEGRPSLAE